MDAETKPNDRPTSVRAKFKVISTKQTMGSVPDGIKDGRQTWKQAEMSSIEMTPVYGNGDPEHENTKFWHASPSGSLTLNCVNSEAARQFELDKEYYVDFTRAD